MHIGNVKVQSLGVTIDQSGGDIGDVINVKSDFGAQGDGVNNDTEAIQAAVDFAGAQGGGVVYFPRGEYIIQPPNISAGYAVMLGGSLRDNIILKGDGATQTIFLFRLYDGQSAGAAWPVVGGAVLRGHAFRVSGSATTGFLQWQDFKIDGGADTTSDHTNPANVSTGDGWDVTHQGIAFNVNSGFDKMVVQNVWMTRFRGENIYCGGRMNNFILKDSKFSEANGSAISVSAENMQCSGNEVYRAFQGFENVYVNGYTTYFNNYVQSCSHGGFHIYPSTAVSEGYCDFHDNRLSNCYLALYAPGARNMRIYNNLFVDCQDNALFLESPGTGGSGIGNFEMHNVEIYGNRFVTNNLTSAHGVFVGNGTVTFAARYLHIHDNATVQSVKAYSASRSAGTIFECNTGTFGPGFRLDRNFGWGGGQTDDANGWGFPQTFTSTATQTWGATVGALNGGMVRAYLSYIVSATCSLNITAKWRDKSGSLTSEALVATSINPGRYNHVFETIVYDTPAGNFNVLYKVDTPSVVTGALDIMRT